MKKKAEPVKPATASLSNRQLFFLAGAIAIITLVSFSPAMNNSFINQDDNIYVFDNMHLSKQIPDAVAYFFEPHYFSGNYIPLTMITYALAYHAAGITPEFFHTVNVFIHLLNVLLVFWFTWLLSGRKPVAAALVSLFFGIHPMHVESVAWVAELKDVLYTFFFIAGLIAYHKYIEWKLTAIEQNPFHKNGFSRLFPVFIFFVLSVLSKPAAIIFPVVLLLLDFYTHRKFDKWAWFEKLPFFAVSFIFGIIAVNAQQADNLLSNHYPFAQRLLFASYAITGYLAKFFIPINLSNFYPYPQTVDGHLPYQYYMTPAIVIMLFYGIYKTLKYSRLPAFGFLFFIVNLILVLQFLSIGNAIMADRYTYVAYIGLLFIVAMGFDQIYHSTNQKLKEWKPYAVTIIIVLAVMCSFLTYARCKVWENQDTIATDLVTKFPDDPIALNNKGYLLFMEGKPVEAIPFFRKAIRLKPDYVKSDYVKAYINLIKSYVALKDYNEALKISDSALNYAPQDYNILDEKGYVLFLQHQYPEALKFYKAAITIKKDDINTLLNLSQYYYELHDYDNWEKTIDLALKYDPDNFLLLNNKGYALFLKGKYNEALVYYKASLDRKPDNNNATVNMANCYRAMSDASKTMK